MPNDFVVAHTGSPGSRLRFLCVTTDTLMVTSTLPDDAVCVRLRSKNSPIDGFCPPVGQKIPKENYVIYHEATDDLEYHEASSVANCEISYDQKVIPLLTRANFKFYRALILYGWSRRSCYIENPSGEYYLLNAMSPPLRYEVWYFEFDSLEDAYLWRNPKPYTLTPYSKSHIASFRSQNPENFFNRGVGFARAADVFLNLPVDNSVPPTVIDDEGSKNVLYGNHLDGSDGLPLSSVVLPAGNPKTLVRLYDDRPVYYYTGAALMQFSRSWFMLTNSNFWDIPLWPLIRQDADINGIGDEQIEVVNSSSNIYILGVENVFPDRYLFQRSSAPEIRYGPCSNSPYDPYAPYVGGVFNLTPSLEKLDPTFYMPYPNKTFDFNALTDVFISFLDKKFFNFYKTDVSFSAILYDNLFYGSYRLSRVKINNSCSLMSYEWDRPNSIYSLHDSDKISRTMFSSSNFVYRYLDSNWRSLTFNESVQLKPRIKLPIRLAARDRISKLYTDSYSISIDYPIHSAIKFGISVIYAVQYGKNRHVFSLPAREFPEICPPNTIPYAQYILNP